MKALSIIALIFAGLSIFIPVGGVYIAILCSLLALISFRSQPTLSGITFGINIINTAFLSPSILLGDAASSGAFDTATSVTESPTEVGAVYWGYVGFHVIVFIIAAVYRLIRGTTTPAEA